MSTRLMLMDHEYCCYPIFDPSFDNFLEKKTKNSKKTMKTQKMHF